MITESTSSLIHSQHGPNFSINNRVRGASSSSDEDEDDTVITTVKAISEQAEVNSSVEGCSNNTDCCSRQQSTAVVLDIEDLLAAAAKRSSNKADTTDSVSNMNPSGGNNGLCSTKFNCGGTSRQNCQTLISEYQDHAHQGLEPLEFPEIVDEHQTMRHTVLLILLLCAMFVVSLPTSVDHIAHPVSLHIQSSIGFGSLYLDTRDGGYVWNLRGACLS